MDTNSVRRPARPGLFRPAPRRFLVQHALEPFLFMDQAFQDGDDVAGPERPVTQVQGHKQDQAQGRDDAGGQDQ
jgi:hypothetical protein